MAWVTKTKKKTHKYNFNNVSVGFYNDKRWKLLRNAYIKHNPLCERCLALYDKVTEAQHVHHIIPFLTGQTDKDRWMLFLDSQNLMSLCAECHRAIHREMEQNEGGE